MLEEKRKYFNPLNPELNPICCLLALLAHHFLHVSRIRVKSLTLRLLMSYIYTYIYIYMGHLFLMFLDHTQRRSTVGRTSLDEWSARDRDLYLTIHNVHNRQTSMPPVELEPNNLSRRTTADLRLRPRSHWDRQTAYTRNKFLETNPRSWRSDMDAMYN